ncbi:MAG: Asp-tRNA(Asn)/Glu-tRNA(Gln) amidotransferase subunit GatB [Planctomycetes bacterium]|nr:Asp-tRNA(Asn)/Glu-tRNA(Gln) amidotransferase subunit GatB [Planctomycetota bacterium]
MKLVDSAYVSPKTGKRWIPVIGLEVHCQLKTRTKLFCGCEYTFGASPNSLTCPVCTGQPGALPVLNEEALALAVRTAQALGAEVASESRFDRKNYFYCDLPKGYQISQFDRPYCKGGGIALANGRFVRLARIHMEEDAGKAIHDRGDATLVDLNRAGVPLIESVTEADIQSAADAQEYLAALKEILQYTGASDCDMEKGSLRCDVNISVHPPGEPWRTKVEIKNLNSFRYVGAAIEHEIARQVAAYESEDPSRYPVQETRLYDPQRGETRSMRGKESAHDYRYMPDPDLPLVHVDAAFLERQRAHLPELPAARRERYEKQYGLTPTDAGVLTSERAVADFFEAVVRAGGRAKEASNWIQNELLRWVGDQELGLERFDELQLRPSELAEVVDLVERGTIQNQAGRKLLREMAKSGRPAKVLVQELGLEQVQDAGRIEEWCRAALVGKEKVIADVRAGKEAALNALLGPVLKLSGGKANVQLVRETLKRLIAETEPPLNP